MQKPSGYVVFFALGALVLVTCTGGAVLYFTRMPDPQTADLGGLLRWLVSRDLSQESETTQEQLLWRLESELRRGLQLSDAEDRLTEEQRARLVENADLLGQRWFAKLVDRYSALAASEKSAFLDHQIEDVQRSGVVKALSSISSDPARRPKNLWTGMMERIARWISRMEPARKLQAQELVAAVESNLFLRTLRSSWFSSPPMAAVSPDS